MEADFTWLGSGKKVCWGATGIVAKAVDTLPEWKRKKVVIFLTRLSNNDKEAEELGNMLLAKKISRQQFLTMI